MKKFLIALVALVVFWQNSANSQINEFKMIASDGAAADYFGVSVSISGDYAIVGAYQDDDNGNNSGSAYIFKRDGINWTEQAKITASDGTWSNEFGYSVSISGDYAIVGAHQDDVPLVFSCQRAISVRAALLLKGCSLVLQWTASSQ